MCFNFLGVVSCQSFNFNPPLTAHQMSGSSLAAQETMDDFDDEDPLGSWFFVTVVVAAGVATGILLPLYLNDKL